MDAEIFTSQAMPSAYSVTKCVSGEALAIAQQQGRNEHKSAEHQSNAKLAGLPTTAHGRQTTPESAS